MKTKLTRKIKLAAFAITMAAFAPTLFAQLTIPYADGSDGALNITSDTVIDLSQAVTGVWTDTSASPGNGTYDPTQWAVVFKYSSVNIAPGVTLSFTNHASRAPVVWLVNGSVTINGTLSLDGQDGNSPTLIEPGPGGFRGGAGGYSSSPGFGPGGGNNSEGYYLNYSYGNTNIIPLIGGSGGSGYGNAGITGGGGGGAILVAASSSITINGSCHANGGYGNSAYSANYFGSGGAVRLVANQILGNGSIQTLGYNINGDPGRIRLEANLVTNTLTIWPVTLGAAPANPPVIFPPASAPTVKILSIGGATTPAEPKAALPSGATANGDVAIATLTASVIQLQTMNFPTNGTVNVYIKPLNGSQTILPATFVSGDGSQALWQVSASLPIYSPLQNQPGYAVIQARAVVP